MPIPPQSLSNSILDSARFRQFIAQPPMDDSGFEVWLSRLQEHLILVEHQIEDADRCYALAVSICDADRELLMTFFPEWVMGEGNAESGAHRAEEAMTNALRALERIQRNGVLNEDQVRHLGKMIANTSQRQKVLQIVTGPGHFSDRRRSAEEEYYLLPEQQ